jgi:hypothetical protein
MGKTAKPKSRHLLKSTAGDFATTATDSARSLIKSHLAENPFNGAFLKEGGFPHRRLPDLSQETRVQRRVIQTRTNPTSEALLQ